MADDPIAVELTREEWRKLQVRLMQAETPNVPGADDEEFQEIVEKIDDQLPTDRSQP